MEDKGHINQGKLGIKLYSTDTINHKTVATLLRSEEKIQQISISKS
jgi:hypothetical protein